ncbi:MAG TPA: M28 family metallopeptidase [Symbiobacteriaceae bacterium]|nr:M28 family metallopeptidase [Symbiobacteriaceae bacterium]
MRFARPLQVALLGLVLAAVAFWGLNGYSPLKPPEQVPSVTLAFDGNRAWKDLHSFVNANPRRVIGSVNGRKSAEYLAGQFKAMGLEPHLQDFEGKLAGITMNLNGVNVYGVSPGSETGTILFTAHRDVVPTTIDGAVDDGSGIGAVMELARVLTQAPHRYTYVFAALDGEEYGLHGARALSFNPPPYIQDIRLVVNMDMIAFRKDSPLQIRNTEYLHPQALALLQRVAAPSKSPLPVVTLKQQPSLNIMTDADQLRWQNLPIVDLVDPDPRSYQHYHKALDTMEYVLPDMLQRTGRLVEELVRTGDVLGAFTPSAGLILTRSRGDQFEYLPPWRMRLAGLAILCILLLPALGVVLRTKKDLAVALRAQWLPLGLVLFIALAGYLTRSPWLPLTLSLVLIIVLRVRPAPDPGLGHLYGALVPGLFFVGTWWAAGQWPMFFPYAVVVWVAVVLVTWRPTWLWRTADVLLMLVLIPVALLPEFLRIWISRPPTQVMRLPAIFAAAPPSVHMWGARAPWFNDSQQAIIALCFTLVLLVAVWGIFARRPAQPAPPASSELAEAGD